MPLSRWLGFQIVRNSMQRLEHWVSSRRDNSVIPDQRITKIITTPRLPTLDRSIGVCRRPSWKHSPSSTTPERKIFLTTKIRAAHRFILPARYAFLTPRPQRSSSEYCLAESSKGYEQEKKIKREKRKCRQSKTKRKKNKISPLLYASNFVKSSPAVS